MDPVTTAAGASAAAVASKVISTGLDGVYRSVVSVAFLSWAVPNIASLRTGSDRLSPLASLGRFLNWLGINDVSWLDNAAAWLQIRIDGAGLVAVVIGMAAVWSLVVEKTLISRAGSSLLLALLLGAEISNFWTGFFVFLGIGLVTLVLCAKLRVIRECDWLKYVIGNIVLSIVAGAVPIFWLVGSSVPTASLGEVSWRPVHVQIDSRNSDNLKVELRESPLPRRGRGVDPETGTIF